MIFNLIDQLRRRGRGALLTWNLDTHTGAQVEAFLRSYGVRILDRKMGGQEVGVWVSVAQAKYADGLLRGGGFLLTSAPLSKPIAPRQRWGTAAKTTSVIGMIGDLFGVGRMADDMARHDNAQPQQRRERYG